jgi:hypothetical protein
MKYKFRYIDKLEPRTRIPAITLGKIIHNAFDLFYRGASDENVTSFISESFDDEIAQHELTDQEDLMVAKFTALGMWAHYPYKDLSRYQDIFSEEEFDVPLGRSRIFRFIGRVDGRVRIVNKWWARELKTTSLNQRQFEQRQMVSPQATGYVYGLYKRGIDCKGVIYDYIKKPLLRKGVSDTAESFGKRIVEDYRNRPQMYYHQQYVYRTPVDLRHFEQDMTQLAREIRKRGRSGKFYRNQDACWSFNAECPYAKICFAETPDPLTVDLYFDKKEDNDARRSATGKTGTKSRV